jgi:RNA polymerase sigma-70 factor (ECF subfamily)
MQGTGARLGLDKEVIYCELLVLRCGRGDRVAWEDLIRHWERRLFYYIRRIVDDEQDAWDVLQQTWMAAYKGVGGIRDGRALPKWLYRTARNLALLQRRRRHPHELLDAGDEGGPPGAADDNGIAFDRVDLVHHGLDQLALAHREVLTLHFLQDLSVPEIAEVTGVPAGTVKSRLHYAKRALRKVIEKGAI